MCCAATTCEREFSVPPKKGRRFPRLSESTKKKRGWDTAGNITEFATAFDPDRITAGPDGNLWFTEPFNDKIGRITPTGVITEFVLSAPAQPRDIVAGADGNLWFTEYIAGILARITPDGVVTKARFRTGPGRMLFQKIIVVLRQSRSW